MAGSPGRPLATGVSELAVSRLSVAVHYFDGHPCVQWRPRIQLGTRGARRTARERRRVRAALPILVRVVPELAERVPRRRFDRVVLGVAPPARITRIEAGGCRAHRDRVAPLPEPRRLRNLLRGEQTRAGTPFVHTVGPITRCLVDEVHANASRFCLMRRNPTGAASSPVRLAASTWRSIT